MTKKIAVIGSNSFSGSDLIDLLLENPGYEVIGISRSPEKSKIFLPYKRHSGGRFIFHQLDLNTDMPAICRTLDTFKPDFIVNFAAQGEVFPSWEHPDHWYQTNVVALTRLAGHLVKAQYLKRYVHISSPEVYGSCPRKIKEDARVNPSSPYAASKAAADLFLFTLVKRFRFPLIMIRSTNVYGAHQQLYKLIPRSVISIKQKKKIPLHMKGNTVRSYIHIRDISRGELAAMLHGKPGEIYHLSPDGNGMTVKAVVQKICDLMNVPFSSAIEYVTDRVGQDYAYRIDSSKARRTLGWKPVISFEQGIGEVIAWIERNWEEIRILPYAYVHKQ